jgi:hypothetical protein
MRVESDYSKKVQRCFSVNISTTGIRLIIYFSRLEMTI